MAYAYVKEWTAICPRCDNHLTHADFICENCGKGKIKAHVEFSGGIGASERSVHFGCGYCDAHAGQLHCNKCGASIQERQIKAAGCFIASAIFGYDSIITRLLRHLRDTILIKFPWGRIFIFWYYKNSQILLKRLGREPH